MATPYVHAMTVDCTDPEVLAAFWGPRPEHRTTYVDLHVDDLEEVTARVLELGGTVLLQDHVYDGTR